jgi:putative drug exporter of the RND superfamily
VPAIAALLGRASWWPARPWEEQPQPNAKKQTVFDAVADG